MSKKLTQEEFERKLKKVHNGEIECLEEYINSSAKILFKHTVCGHIWKAVPFSILKGHSCPKCAINRRVRTQTKTHEQFLKDLNRVHNGEIECLEEYKNNNTKIPFKHAVCGHIWEAVPSSILQGYGCPKCKIKKIIQKNTKDKNYFLEQLQKINPTIIPLEEYKNNKTHIRCKCLICNYEWKVTPDKLLQGRGCPQCAGKKKLTNKEFLIRLAQVHNNEIECLEEYINIKTKLLFKHISCGHIWKTRPDDILRGKGCPKCASPKGEKSVEEILNKLNINLKTQYKIIKCKNINPLPFDFAIFDNNNNLVFLLEYDGQQHFKSISIWGGEKGFKEQKLRDQIKNDYCKDNNIPLERIAYNDWKNKGDLENIIVQLLEKHNLIHTNIKGVNHG